MRCVGVRGSKGGGSEGVKEWLGAVFEVMDVAEA